MRLLHSIAGLRRLDGPVVFAIGVFDGVHLGHQAVIERALTDAEAFGGTAVALTFHPHPIRVLRPDLAPRLLTSTAHKIRLIEALGIGWLLTVGFDAAFAAQSPEVFIGQLVDACEMREICVGTDWAFGKDRVGDVAFLRRIGAERNFVVADVPSVTLDGEAVSSTRIRHAVRAGDLETARRCLGRDFTILGTVGRGRQVGREIGFPTANLRAHNEKFPPDGVYAIRATLEGRVLTGVANIGYRPTVGSDSERTLEVHFFDFAEEIYGRDVEVTFVKFLRGERKFDGLDALKAQIGRDAAEARAVLG